MEDAFLLPSMAWRAETIGARRCGEGEDIFAAVVLFPRTRRRSDFALATNRAVFACERLSASGIRIALSRDMAHRRVRGKDRPRKAGSVYEPSESTVTTMENQLLGALPPTVLARLTPHLEPVHLQQKEMLFRAHEPLRFAYFPTTAVISFVSTLESGESLEVGLVGCDGLAGTTVFPGMTMMACDAVVRVAGEALRISADVLHAEVLADETLCSTLGGFAQVLHVRCMHMSVCNMFHSVEQRCIRWLLMVNDVIHNGDIPLTHEVMATMLGVHRPTVTLVLRSLHKAGMVNEARRRIVISNRHRLELACCECYGAMRAEQKRLLGY